MKKSHVHVRLQHLRKYVRREISFVLALLVLAIGAFVFSTDHRQAFTSAEVQFADASPTGLQIVPASCPSQPPGVGDYPHDDCSPPPPPPPPATISLSKTQLSYQNGQNCTAAGAVVRPGDEICYRMNASVSGAPQNWFTIRDAIPAGTTLAWQGRGTTYISSDQIAGGVDGNGDIWWQEQFVPAGWSTYVDFTVRVNQNVQDGTAICNTARANSQEASVTSSNQVCNAASNPLPDLTADAPRVYSGDTIVGSTITLVGTIGNFGAGNTTQTFANSFEIDVDNGNGTWDLWRDNANDMIGLSGTGDPGNNTRLTYGEWTNLPAGTHLVRLCADMAQKHSWASLVAESDESNNCGPSTTITVTASAAKCPDGSAAPNNDASQCTCAQGNVSACATGCQISASPQSVASGGATTLTWSTACSPTYGCSYFGLPVTARDAELNGVSVNPDDSQIVIPLFGGSTSETYALTGNYYYGIWPLLFKLDGYSCQTSVSKSAGDGGDGDGDADARCSDGTPAPGGDVSRCPSCQRTPVTASCVDNPDGTQTARSTFGTCGRTDQLCRYAAAGYGCFTDSEGAHCEEPPPPEVTFDVWPTLVHSGSSVQVTLEARYVDECSISSSAGPADGRFLNDTLGNDWSVSADYPSRPITGQTIFTLHCEGIRDGTSVDKVETVNLIPRFQEPTR